MNDILLNHATILTMDEAGTQIDDGFIAISGDRISALGPMHACPADDVATTVDCSGCVVLPGLVNAHTHLPMVYFRGIADDLNLDVWLKEHIFPAETRHVNPEFVYNATLLALAELFRSGVTCVNDMYMFAAKVARACCDAGMRGCIGEGVISFPTVSAPTWQDGLKLAGSLLDEYADHSLITPTVCAHSPYTCTPECLRELRVLADDREALFHIHVHETAGEAEMIEWGDPADTPVHALKHLGVLGPRTVAAHCVWVDDHDLLHMMEAGAGVAHCPTSNLKLGSGIAPVHGMVEAGVKVGIGTDGAASNNNLNMWEELHLAALLAKGVYKDASVVPATAALEFATREGAKILGVAECGSLESGKLADLQVLELDELHMSPRYPHSGALTSQLVYGAQACQVRDTMVGGKFVMRDRELTTLDEQQLKADARAWVKQNFS